MIITKCRECTYPTGCQREGACSAAAKAKRLALYKARYDALVSLNLSPEEVLEELSYLKAEDGVS